MPLEAIPREKILGAIHALGPVQPLDVRRHLGMGDTMLIGAILSEMASKGLVAITRTKRGGSPFYYDPQKNESLEKLSEYLPDKDRQTWQYLKSSSVLREDELDPLTRVSLQNIPDFARRFAVDDVVYWRYYLIREEDARAEITPPAPAAPVVKEEILEEVVPETPKPIEKQIELPQSDDPLFAKLARFAATLGTLSKPSIIKPGVELTCYLETKSPYGTLRTRVCAYARKTFPETIVWQALLEARSEGLPLLIVKDSPFPKSLSKKFANVPNVYFQKI